VLVLSALLLADCAAASDPDVVQIAPPTGVLESDRASIIVALEQARPGGTIQFAPGTYLVLANRSALRSRGSPSWVTPKGQRFAAATKTTSRMFRQYAIAPSNTPGMAW
jgi:hypothetical protein